MKIRAGFQYIGELPPGDWKMRTYGDAVILVCPEHEPRIVRDGKISILKSAYQPI